MPGKPATLGDVCAANVLHTKWLLAPTRRIGHQWIEMLVRSGQSVVNLHPTTVQALALDLAGAAFAEHDLTLVSRAVGSLIVDATWGRLCRAGYLGRLNQSADLSATVYESLLALRMAGCRPADIKGSDLESAAKAEDIRILLSAHESFLQQHRLVDEADVLNRATARVRDDSQAIPVDTMFLIPAGLQVTALEQRFLDALPAVMRVEIAHPAAHESSADIRRLANVARPGAIAQPKGDGSVKFYQAVGEVNEVREVFRRCMEDQQPLDDVEILHTDRETYVSLIHDTARRYFSDPARPDGVPVTFAEGIPASLSRPGRALVSWLEWIHEGYPQRRLVDMIADGLLQCGDDEELSFGYLVRLLRPIAIGMGADNYVRKLDQQIRATRPKVTRDSDDAAHDAALFARKRKGLQTLRRLIGQLLDLSREVKSGPGISALVAAQKFLSAAARSVNELDGHAAEALVRQMEDRRVWLQRLGISLDLREWLAALPGRIRVLDSGPRPGHLHVAHIGSGGHSGRQRTFVVGLDDGRFPGAALQDPILLDRERARVSPNLSTSAVRLRLKIDELAGTLARLGGSVTLSWPCLDLADDRETFPSSVVLSAYRRISGRSDADLEALQAEVGPPVSFAPTTADKALDESERWLWRLTDVAIQGTNQLEVVESHFPHLARGRAAARQRGSEFGSFNGYVPRAGQDLNPFATDAPVLSASALETAGRCPLAFFFRSGLALYPPEELVVDADRWLNPAQFGLLLHEVFRRFMDELSCAGQRPEFERDQTRLAEILREAIEQWRQEIPAPNENAFRMQYWQLLRTSRIFLVAEEKHCRTNQPRFFEVALGLDSVASGSPLDQLEPTSVALAAGKSILVKGQIDRVDESAPARYTVWDYKVGSGYGYDRKDAFCGGRRVQSVLYLKMIETALRARLDPQAIVERFGYFFASVRAHGMRVPWDSAALAPGLSILERLCDSMASGAFPATDDVEDCRYCDYAAVCGDVQRVAAQSKVLLDRDDLVPLRHFRELRRGKS